MNKHGEHGANGIVLMFHQSSTKNKHQLKNDTAKESVLILQYTICRYKNANYNLQKHTWDIMQAKNKCISSLAANKFSRGHT